MFREKAELLERDFGLYQLLLQNDLEEVSVIELLMEEGLIDLDNYFFSDNDIPIWEEDNE